MTKIGIKYNQQHAISDHATIRRSTSNPETSLPEFTKTIILQKIKAYEEKQSARQALRRLVKITTSETKPGEKPPLRINTELEFKVEIRRKTPSSSQESSPCSSKRSSDDGTASPSKKRKSLPWKERLFFAPAETLKPEWREAQKAKIPPARQVKMSTDSDITIKPGPYDLPEDLQEYEGMQLDPSTTPKLWEGPLPVPRPQTPSKQTPIEDITEDVFIEPRTLNPEPEEAYPDDLYMEEEIPEPESHEPEPMDTGKDPDPPEPPQLIAAPTPTKQETTQTKTTEHAPSGGGYFPPTTTQKKRQRKKIPPPIQPKMKKGGLKDLQQYNQEFKRWQMRLVGCINDNKETIKAYVSGLANKVMLMLLKDGHEFKKTKTLVKWQQAAETAVAKREGKAGQESTAEKTKSVRPPLHKLKELKVWEQMKKLMKADRKKIIEETAIKFLDGKELIAVINRLEIDTMVITKRKSLDIPVDVVTYNKMETVKALIDSGATNNFIDFRTVAKLRLGTKKLPRARQLFNVNGTHNQAGLIEESVHLYIDRGDERIETQLHITNLGRDRLILGYPWLEAFNPEINWAEGKLLGPRTTLKTTGAVAQEHVNEAYEIQRMAMQARKTTIAQKMAEAFKTDKPKNDAPVPTEYRRHVKVFSEKEAERFLPSHAWDHRIPLKDDAPETINEKVYNLPKANKLAIEEWVYKMLEKKFIQRSDSRYGHATFTVPKKDGTFWIVQDYRPVNKYTKKDTTPLPSIQDAVESLGDKILFSKFDIREGYNNIQLIPEDRWKAAFKTHIGLFEPTVMVFGLQGAPGTFSRMIAVDVAPMYHEFPPNRFKHYMDDCLIATADGELTLHRKMNHRLLDIFEEHLYFLKPSKCEFERTEIDFLGVRLGNGQITIDPSKNGPGRSNPSKRCEAPLASSGFNDPSSLGLRISPNPLPAF
jgi:Reverse transcriptase (RNA-dependent DNA polymerase)